jgi:hypothetical protein
VAAQPTGTVTLVFTDIEGSTRLLEELGQEAYREALGGHRRIVREAFGRFDGYEVDYEGDAFFYAFASATAAVAAVELARFAASRGDADRAGRLWGAVESEEERRPVGQWEQEREGYAAPILAAAGPGFEVARASGRALALDAAVDYALGED